MKDHLNPLVGLKPQINNRATGSPGAGQSSAGDTNLRRQATVMG